MLAIVRGQGCKDINNTLLPRTIANLLSVGEAAGGGGRRGSFKRRDLTRRAYRRYRQVDRLTRKLKYLQEIVPMDFSYESMALEAISIGARSVRERFVKVIDESSLL